MKPVVAAEVLIVGEQITKQAAHAALRAGQVVRAGRGVYFSAAVAPGRAFQVYGVRLAAHWFHGSALSHSSAWLRRVARGRLFLAGGYARDKPGPASQWRIVLSRSAVPVKPGRFYEGVSVEDPLGRFEMLCATPEWLLLQSVEAVKMHAGKQISPAQWAAVYAAGCERQGGEGALLLALEEMARSAGQDAAFQRVLLKRFRRVGTRRVDSSPGPCGNSTMI